MVLWALRITRQKKPKPLLIAGESSSHLMTCVTKIMKEGWRLGFQPCEAQNLIIYLE